MKFHLKTLLLLVTVCGIIIAFWLHRARQQAKLESHRDSFRDLEEVVSSLDSVLESQLLSMPSVMDQLKQSSPVDPKMALSHSVMGDATFFGRYKFSRHFTYSWQVPSGTRVIGVDLMVRSVIDEDSFGDHVVTLSYPTTETNTTLADVIESELGKHDAKVIHEQRPQNESIAGE